MPVAVLHRVFRHHGIIVPQYLRERRKVEKRLDIGQILRHDALLAHFTHVDARSAAVSGQPVHPLLARDLLIMARAGACLLYTSMDIINRANRYVHIMTPYLIIDNEMITALTYAARRGVEVQLILPHVPDKEIAFSLAHKMCIRDRDPSEPRPSWGWSW